MSEGQTAIVTGVGPGLGIALVRCFAGAGIKVAIAARGEKQLKKLLPSEYGDRVRAYPTDVADEGQVAALFENAARDLGAPDLVVFNAGSYAPGGILDIEVEDLERCWRVGCLGGFLVGRAAARRMLPRGAGTILFTGATASLRGSANFINLAVPKFGLRALAQSMARELGPQGIHVAHTIIDGQIEADRKRNLPDERGPDTRLKPEHIAETYLHIHRQPRTTWTHEVDLRPFVEKF